MAIQPDAEQLVKALQSSDTSTSTRLGQAITPRLVGYLQIEPDGWAGMPQEAFVADLAATLIEEVTGAGEAGEASIQTDPAAANASALATLLEAQADWAASTSENDRLASIGGPHC